MRRYQRTITHRWQVEGCGTEECRLNAISKAYQCIFLFRPSPVFPDHGRISCIQPMVGHVQQHPLYAPQFQGSQPRALFPKSWWGGSTSVKAYTDLNHLYPSEAAANQAKSNYVLGEVDMSYKVTFDNGVVKVGYPLRGQGGGQTTVFEPDEEYKGRFCANIFLYGHMLSGLYMDIARNSHVTAESVSHLTAISI